MALYYDAAAMLSSQSSSQGSLKSRVYDSNAIIKSPRPLLYGLVTECARWDVVLSEVIDNTGIINQEPKVCYKPVRLILALLADTAAVGLANSAARGTTHSRSPSFQTRDRLPAEPSTPTCDRATQGALSFRAD
jgi:hypothetical protein